MIKITYKLIDGSYKSKYIKDHELPETAKKLLEARIKKQIKYWFKEQINETE
jgi:hypothetical protein